MKRSDPEEDVVYCSRIHCSVWIPILHLEIQPRIQVTGSPVLMLAGRHQAGPQLQLPPQPRKTCRKIKHNECKDMDI